jgi:hypothetical protein
MSTQRATVHELKEHWEKPIDTRKEGDFISLSRMPPWNDICSELDWGLYLVDGGRFSRKQHGYCGVYRLIALASEGDATKPAVLNRLCGQDTTGTLYIGCARRLSDRLNQLRRSLRGREDTHGAIRMLNRIPLLDYPTDRLAIALLFTFREFERVEGDLLEAYMNSFGDTPPLNFRY